jgi:putative transposase
MRQHKIGRHCVFNINYHLVFCPKYRKPLLTNDLAKDLENIINDTAKKIDVQIESLAIQPDHVHIFVSAKPNLSPHIIVKRIKGASSNILRKKYKHILSKLPCLWSSSYYIGTAGCVSESVIKMYIENQKNI